MTPRQRERIVRLVRDGLSLRAIERLTGHRRETVSRYARREGFEVARRLGVDPVRNGESVRVGVGGRRM